MTMDEVKMYFRAETNRTRQWAEMWRIRKQKNKRWLLGLGTKKIRWLIVPFPGIENN